MTILKKETGAQVFDRNIISTNNYKNNNNNNNNKK